MPLGRHTGQKTGRKRVDDRYRKKGGDQASLIGAYTCHPPNSDSKEKTQTTMSFSPKNINPPERKNKRTR